MFHFPPDRALRPLVVAFIVFLLAVAAASLIWPLFGACWSNIRREDFS